MCAIAATTPACSAPIPNIRCFFDHSAGTLRGDPRHDLTHPCGSGIEGIGRPKVERSFIAACVDAMVKVPDALSLAAMRHVSAALGRRVGGSIGTNMVGVPIAAERMRREGRSGSIVTILCDGGERYSHSYYNTDWYAEQGIDMLGSDAATARAVVGHGMPDIALLVREG